MSTQMLRKEDLLVGKNSKLSLGYDLPGALTLVNKDSTVFDLFSYHFCLIFLSICSPYQGVASPASRTAGMGSNENKI